MWRASGRDEEGGRVLVLLLSWRKEVTMRAGYQLGWGRGISEGSRAEGLERTNEHGGRVVCGVGLTRISISGADGVLPSCFFFGTLHQY